MDKPKVFISYSWTPITNKNWVENFADRMCSDGVIVILDIWDLKPGSDKYHFMEQMVNDSKITKVLLICNKDYCEKANSKKGGVGTESMIISNEIYSNVKQDKFIPILREYGPERNPCLPRFLSSRLYFDFSDYNSENFENEYQGLIRNIFNKPLKKKPPIGDPPLYITSSSQVKLKIAHKVRSIKNSLFEDKDNSQIFINDYYESFIASLDDFIVENKEINIIEEIDDFYIEEIESLKLLRDNYVEFLITLCKFSKKMSVEELMSFFNDLISYYLSYQFKDFKIRVYSKYQGAHIGFFLREIYLYTVAVLLKYKKFEVLGELINNSYLYYDESKEEYQTTKFTIFEGLGYELFEYRKRRLNLKQVDLRSETIKKRADNKYVNLFELVEVDLLLYYISLIRLSQAKSNERFGMRKWHPILSLYYDKKCLKNISKIVSKSYFNEFKSLLNVKDKNELMEVVKLTLDIKGTYLDSFYFRIPRIEYIFDINKVSKY